MNQREKEYAGCDRCGRWERGSFTVEATLLFGSILACIFLVISYGFFVHQKVYFTASAYEASMTEDGEETKAALLLKEAPLTMYLPEVKVSDSKTKTQVIYEGEIFSLFDSYSFTYKSKGAKKHIRPVEHIRLVRLGLETIDIFTGD